MVQFQVPSKDMNPTNQNLLKQLIKESPEGKGLVRNVGDLIGHLCRSQILTTEERQRLNHLQTGTDLDKNVALFHEMIPMKGDSAMGSLTNCLLASGYEAHGTFLLENVPELRSQTTEGSVDTEALYKVLVIGSAGNGKSTFCNRLMTPDGEAEPRQEFVESEHADSETKETVGKLTHWKNDLHLFVIDTPGINDSEGLDAKHMQDMVTFIKGQKTVNAICLLFNYQNDRFDENVKKIIRLFCTLFNTATFWSHVCLVFSKVHSYTPASVKQRGIEVKREEYSKKVRDMVQGMGMDLPVPPSCYFLDLKDMTDQSTNFDLNAISAWISALSPISTENLEVISTKYMKSETERRERVIKTEAVWGEKWRGWAGWGNKKPVYRGDRKTWVEEEREKHLLYDGTTWVYDGDWKEIRRWNTGP